MVPYPWDILVDIYATYVACGFILVSSRAGTTAVVLVRSAVRSQVGRKGKLAGGGDSAAESVAVTGGTHESRQCLAGGTIQCCRHDLPDESAMRRTWLMNRRGDCQEF